MPLVHETYLEEVKRILERSLNGFGEPPATARYMSRKLAEDLLPVLEELARERIYGEEEKHTGTPTQCMECGNGFVPLTVVSGELGLCGACS